VAANPAVILRSANRAEIVARALKKDIRDRTALVIEVNQGVRSDA